MEVKDIADMYIKRRVNEIVDRLRQMAGETPECTTGGT